MITVEMTISETARLIKNEDLNHHHTLFAGKGLSFMLESGFLSAAEFVSPEHLRFIHCSEMDFTKPVLIGQILKFKSRVLLTGKSSLTVNVKMFVNNIHCGEGFLTFVQVTPLTNSEGVTKWVATPHNVEVIAVTEEDKKLQEHAITLKNN